MEALEAIRGRRSIRSYESTPLQRGEIEDLIDAGRLAATGRGEEPCEFVVVTDPAVRRELAGICDYGRFIAQAPCCSAVLCRECKYFLEDGSAATQNILVGPTPWGWAPAGSPGIKNLTPAGSPRCWAPPRNTGW